jgi:hypothetical protein
VSLKWFPVALAALSGCAEPYIPEAALADCSSRSVNSAGIVTYADFDFKGWPIREEVQVDGADPVITETEYSRVAGRVVQSLSITPTPAGDLAVTRDYDGRENLERIETNIAGDEPITCTLTYTGESLTQSVCSDGVTTRYDDCENPDDVEFEGGVESIGYAYRGCQILSGLLLGEDSDGPYQEAFQYSQGREVSRVRERNDSLFATYTTWDCPAAE